MILEFARASRIQRDHVVSERFLKRRRGFREVLWGPGGDFLPLTVVRRIL